MYSCCTCTVQSATVRKSTTAIQTCTASFCCQDYDTTLLLAILPVIHNPHYVYWEPDVEQVLGPIQDGTIYISLLFPDMASKLFTFPHWVCGPPFPQSERQNITDHVPCTANSNCRKGKPRPAPSHPYRLPIA